MSRTGVILGIATALWGLCLAGCNNHVPETPPESASLEIKYEQQQADLWCWSASAVMISRTLGKEVKQCDVSELQLATADCCPDPSGKPLAVCDKTGWPPFQELGFLSTRTHDTPVSYEQLKYEIGIAKRPLAGSWEYVTASGTRLDNGHMVVVGGYRKLGGIERVEIYDPLCDEESTPQPGMPCGYSLIRYSEYVEGEWGNGTIYKHWDDFYEIRKP